MTIISGIILLGLLGFSGYKELNARRKRAKIYSLEKKICEEPVYVLKDDKLIPYKEGMVIGSGATAISLYELYSVSEDHEQVLNVLSERFPNKFPEDTSLIDFISDFAEKIEKGEASVQGLVSGITGELGEMAAVDYLNQLPELKEHGIQAVQFVSKTHKGTDLRFEYADGSPAPVEVVPGANGETMVKVVDSKREVFEQIQVKSYTVDNMDNFMADVRTNPDVDNYIVNKELFAALKENGKLDVLNSHGVNVVPGDWSHAAHVEEASALFNHVEEGLDIAEDIPLVALAFFGYKAVANIKDYTRGAATGEECRTKITADAIRIPVAGGTGFVGAKAGAYIGTIINPGIGTVIGGGVGAIVGAIGVVPWLGV